MTRKDYEATAQVIRNLPVNEDIKRVVALRFAGMFETDNERFNIDLFLNACEC